MLTKKKKNIVVFVLTILTFSQGLLAMKVHAISRLKSLLIGQNGYHLPTDSTFTSRVKNACKI